jgi:penicillin-binding protein 1A
MKKGSEDARREPTFAPSVRAPSVRADVDDDDEPPRRAPPSRRRVTKRRSDKPKRSFFGPVFYWCFTLGIWALIGGGALVAYYATQLPPIDQLAIPKRPPNIAILGEDGTPLANRGDTGGAAIHLADLPAYLPKAFVAIEDRRFYSHHGVDPVGIFRALTRNVIGRGGMQGGSTLTQQLAKNLFLTQERTFSRKIQEVILALWLEHKYSKNQILELYLNRVYFGSGVYGVEAAALKYFGHDASAVTLPEAAVLAGLMKAPTKYAPNRNPQAATERAAQVIGAMEQEGYIPENTAKIALALPAHAVHDQRNGSINYAADYVVDVLNDTIGAIDEDIVVTTTLSPPLQAAAEKSLTDELDKKGVKFGATQGALVAMSPDGEIKALVGGRNYADSQFDRVVAAKRQPGSAFKPFVYLAALEHGLTPDTLREDAPINVRGWQPENYSREYLGAVPLTKALSQSLNTVAVRLGLEVGAKTVVKVAHRLGITSDLQANASIALGTSEVTPLELVTAYAPFANGGIGVQAHIVTKVTTANGKVLYLRKGASNGRVIDPAYVPMMNMMMQETLLTGTARKADLPGWQAAGKTGTSQDFRDAWFIGYTSHMITGIWIGNDDNSPTKHASGGSLPVEIWSGFMKAAHKNVPPDSLPLGIWRPAPALPDNPIASLLPNFMRQETAANPAGPAARPREIDAYGNPYGNMPAAGVPPAGGRGDVLTRDSGSRDAAHGGLVPPEGIPNAGANMRPRPAPLPEHNFFSDLFGG